MDVTPTNWPNVDRLIWTLATIGLACGPGLIVNAIGIRRLQAMAARTSDDWDDAVVAELRKRIPLWSVLVGLWLSVGYWPLQARSAALLSHVIVALAVLSVTMAASAIAVRLIGALAPRVNPEVQV
jgi:hypothetical protein